MQVLITAPMMKVIIKLVHTEANALMWKKMADYTQGDANQLRNFYAAADFLNLDVRQVWAVYFYKQVAAVLSWAKTGKVESEGLFNRMVDIVNYAALGLAIAVAEGDFTLGSGEELQDFLARLRCDFKGKALTPLSEGECNED